MMNLPIARGKAARIILQCDAFAASAEIDQTASVRHRAAGYW
jgi:hypothetical protein